MTLLCPACGATVAATGPTAACPKCGTNVPVPAAYAPSVPAAADPAPGAQWVADKPAPPPGFVPPKAEKPADPRAAADAPPKAGGTAVPAAVLGWVPLGGFVAALALACFPWVGAYPGGVRVFSQNGWEAWTGSYTTNALAEAVPDLKTADAAIRAALRGSLVLSLYFPLLLLAVAAAAVEKVFANPDSTTLPGPLAWLPKVWPVRHRLLAALAVALVALAALENVRGYGLESAVKTVAAAKFEADLKAAETGNAADIVKLKAGMEAGRFAVTTGTAAAAVLAVHLLAALAAVYRAWRGPAAAPRVDVSL